MRVAQAHDCLRRIGRTHVTFRKLLTAKVGNSTQGEIWAGRLAKDDRVKYDDLRELCEQYADGKRPDRYDDLWLDLLEQCVVRTEKRAQLSAQLQTRKTNEQVREHNRRGVVRVLASGIRNILDRYAPEELIDPEAKQRFRIFAHEAVEMGRLVRLGKLSKAENDRRMDQLAQWYRKGGQLPQ